MTDIASLSLEVRSDQVKQANVELRAMGPAASAAERAAQKWGMSANAAAQSTENFSRRVQASIRSLEFERQQLTRTAAEQERYTALRRAGVSAASAEGQAITASVRALQAQRSATQAGAQTTSLLAVSVQRLAAAYGAAFIARKIFEASAKAANLGEEAEQVGATVEGLQALRYVALQNNVSLENLDTALAKFSRTLGEAGEGNKEAIESFRRVGVNILDAQGRMRPMQDSLVDLARSITGIEDPSARASAAVAFFGKSGQRMLPALAAISQGFDRLQKDAAKGIVPKEAADSLDKFADRASVVWAEQMANLAKIGNFGVQAFNWLNDLQKQIPPIGMIFEDLWDGVRDGLTTIIASGAGFTAGFLKALSSIPAGLKNLFVLGMDNALEAIESGLNRITTGLAGTWLGRQLGITGGGANLGRIGGGVSPDQFAATTNAKIAEAQQAAFNDVMGNGDTFAQQRQRARNSAARRAASDGGVVQGGPLTATTGVSLPGIKSTGSDPYAKAIESAREYTALKNAETQAIGLNAEAAARLKHEQELINKASADANTLTPAQIANLKGLAAAMAEADSKFAAAKFMDNLVQKSNEFIQSQEIERATLYMGTEAAMAYRLEQEAINRAKAEGISLGPQEIDQIRQIAAAQAEAAEKTRKAKEWVDFERETFKGFFSDFSRGLREGATVWEAFGKAGENALTKIADKLLDMATQQLFEKALGGTSGGGGILGSLVGWIGGALAGAGGGMFGAGAGISPNAALGRAFGPQGEITAFARGGIVDRPTLFPFAKGTGLMGEAGPEGILPLRRGRGGRLGVEASGAGGGRPIIVVVTGDTDLVRVAANDAAVRVVNKAAPGIKGSAVREAGNQVVPITGKHHAEAEGDWRVSR